MITLYITGADGVEKAVTSAGDESLMESIRDNGFDELLALCGGSCSCATCHVYVDSRWADVIGKPVDDEDDLLDSSDYRQPNSRLSCQIPVTKELDGLHVTIARMS